MLGRVTSRRRPVDIGSERAQRLIAEAGREIRHARQDRDLSMRSVGAAIGRSEAHVSRVERGLLRSVSVYDLARLHAVVGLELSIRSFPGGAPLRDAGQQAVISSLCSLLHPSLGWSTEVPMPRPGDQRAWDIVIRGHTWRAGVDVETGPRDGQALTRRTLLKQRDSDVDVAILVLPTSDRIRRFLREAGEQLRSSFPTPGQQALNDLREGRHPGGNAVIVLPARARSSDDAG